MRGAKIAVQAHACDQGSRVYCSVDLVVVDHHYVSSDLLALDEGQLLQKHGWSLADGDTRFKDKIPQGALAYLRRMYYDTTLSTSPFAMKPVLDLADKAALFVR